MSAADFTGFASLFPNETVTHSYVQDIPLPAAPGKESPGTFALVTLDNGLDHSKPTTLGPNTLVELGTVLEGLRDRAARGEIAGVGVTGKPYYLVAGADLSAVKSLEEREQGLHMAQLGHDVYATLATWAFPASPSSTAPPWAADWKSHCSPPTAPCPPAPVPWPSPKPSWGWSRAGAVSICSPG